MMAKNKELDRKQKKQYVLIVSSIVNEDFSKL